MRFEHEIDSMTQKEKAEQTRLYDGSVANAKELEALQHDVANLQKRRSDREDELLVARWSSERRSRPAPPRPSARRRSSAPRSIEVAGDSARGARRPSSPSSASGPPSETSIAAEIDPDLLELYEDLRAQKKGVGAAALVDGVCQGCHEQLSAMQLDKLKKTDGIRRCEHCRRILVF